MLLVIVGKCCSIKIGTKLSFCRVSYQCASFNLSSSRDDMLLLSVLVVVEYLLLLVEGTSIASYTWY